MEAASTTRPAVVLIANDQEWSARSLDSILSPQGFAVIRAYTGQQAIDRALASRPDLVILDAQLPDIHGMDVCRQLRADPRVGHLTPIVITTAGPSGRVQRLAAYAAGAWEFLGQPLDGEALLARLGTFLSIKREADLLHQAALVDATSGLYTLHGLARRMEEIGSDAVRHGRPLACIALGIGRTPPSPGIMPVRLGQLLKEQGRTSDAIAHLGDGEFLVVAPDTGGPAVQKLVNRIEAAVKREMADSAGELLVGYSVVEDVRVAEVEPAILLDRATTALRYVMGNSSAAPVASYDSLPVPATT